MEYNQQNLEHHLLQLFLAHPLKQYSVQEIVAEFQDITRYKVEYRLNKLAEQGNITCRKQRMGIVTRHYWQIA